MKNCKNIELILLVGFNNWGKSTLLKKLFNVNRFYPSKSYSYNAYDYCVIQASNDDLGKVRYINSANEIIKKCNSFDRVISAFCPTRELNNNSADILNGLYSNFDVHMILIENKWCEHASLNVSNIISYYNANLKNRNGSIKFYTLKNNKIGDLKKIVDNI